MISSSPNSSSSSSFRLLNPFDRTNPRNNLISEVESMDIAEPVAESIDREVVEHCRLLVGLRLSNLYVIFLRCPDEDPNCAALNTLSCESKASVDFRRGDSSSQLSPSSSIGDNIVSISRQQSNKSSTEVYVHNTVEGCSNTNLAQRNIANGRTVQTENKKKMIAKAESCVSCRSKPNG
jgi:hypothetical protein